MDRRKFIQTSCTACLSASALAGLISSCTATRYIAGKMNNNGLLINTEEFSIIKNGVTSYRSFIIIRNDSLQFPICVYRFSDNEYTALWMRCTHQGAVLQASGDSVECPAHGSAFSTKGRVTSGPADKDLRTFPVTVNNNELFIDLRKA
jgi:Rieske Fe-S protein